MHAYTVSAQQLAGLATIQAPGHMAWLRPARGQQHHPPMAMAMGMEMEASQVALLRFPVPVSSSPSRRRRPGPGTKQDSRTWCRETRDAFRCELVRDQL